MQQQTVFPMMLLGLESENRPTCECEGRRPGQARQGQQTTCMPHVIMQPIDGPTHVFLEAMPLSGGGRGALGAAFRPLPGHAAKPRQWTGPRTKPLARDLCAAGRRGGAGLPGSPGWDSFGEIRLTSHDDNCRLSA